jgi:DNA polymerase-3 subunit alpha
LYQEQVMQSASALAGYTLGEADLLRRAMGKKKKAVMAEQRDKFINGAQKNSVDPQKAGEIFDIIEKFAGYGFNKSHSAAYALISYRTAWLKAHYGPEFLASYLTSIVGSKMEVLGQYIRSVRDAGYPVLPPDINESREDFTVVGNVIRLGLSAIAKAGKTAVASIVKTRDENGNFKSVWDFCRKIDSRAVNKGVVENLVKAGAFDSLESNRAKVLAAIPEFMDIASKHSVDTNQSSLFVEVDDADLEPEMREVEDFSLREKLNYEKESTGLYISGHPFDKYQPQVKNYITCSLTNLPLWQASQEPVITAGLLSGIKERFTKKGDAMGIAEIEDAESKTEVVIFPRTWAKYKPMLIIGELYLVKGQPREDRGMSILAEEIFTEENYKDSITPHVIITINSETVDEKFYGGFLNVLKHNTGRHNVILRVNTPDQSIVSLLQQKVEPGEKLTKELNVFAGDCISCE